MTTRTNRDPGSRRRRAALPALLAVILLAAPGCLFTPREAEPPASAVAVDYLDQTSPENVWANLGKSLENTDSGGWERNISEEFVYVADDDALGQYAGAFGDVGDVRNGWLRTQEVEFIRKFYGFGPNITDVKMVQEEFEPPTAGNEVEWRGVIYDLTVETGGSFVRYRGSANVTFAFEGTEYYVTRWEDIAGESDPDNPTTVFPTFGILRGETASN